MNTDYDWDKIIAELPGGKLYLTYPGDDGSEDNTTRMLKAADYADWVYASAQRAAMQSMLERVTPYQRWSREAGLFGHLLNILTLGGWSYWRMLQRHKAENAPRT